MRSSTNTLNYLILSTDSTTLAGQLVVEDMPRPRRSVHASKSVENAVYAYIRAVRALGRTRITTPEVADALSLSLHEVNGALSALKKRGIRALNV